MRLTLPERLAYLAGRLFSALLAPGSARRLRVLGRSLLFQLGALLAFLLFVFLLKIVVAHLR